MSTIEREINKLRRANTKLIQNHHFDSTNYAYVAKQLDINRNRIIKLERKLFWQIKAGLNKDSPLNFYVNSIVMMKSEDLCRTHTVCSIIRTILDTGNGKFRKTLVQADHQYHKLTSFYFEQILRIIEEKISKIPDNESVMQLIAYNRKTYLSDTGSEPIFKKRKTGSEISIFVV